MWIILTFALDGERPLSPARKRDSVSAAGQILVVDDDPSIRMVLEAVLAAHSFDVQTAQDGREALDRITEARPDVVLLDLYMPVMDGWEVLAHLEENLPSLPVVVMSAAPPDRVAGTIGHASGYLPKPFNVDQLVQAVVSAADRPQ
jgi:two-component system response regulator GlrR